MAVIPYFILSPNTVLSLIGLIHGPDSTVPTPAEDWRQAKVDLIIPALNEERNIALCLASVLRQTLKPRQIILIDDGGTDKTITYAKSFCAANGLEITTIKRAKPIGKTPTLKRQARELDSDVEFILDGDTVLESDNYIERTVQELYQAVGIASVCGTILPLRDKDRRQILDSEPLKEFTAQHPEASLRPCNGRWRRFRQAMTNIYRESLYMYLQKFVYRGQMTMFGSISSPVGCAVAYRRKYVQELFDQYEPTLGDDLTNSEDIFIGFAMLNRGYRNIQLTDVYARSTEPEVQRLPGQIYSWSSAFLQSCYYFNDLMKSPEKAAKRYYHRYKTKNKYGKEIEEKRKIKEPYRQTFGNNYTSIFGRPIGWVLFMSALEKVSFPAAMLIMLILGLWEPLAITIAAESIISIAVLAYVARGQRLEYAWKGLVATPMRYTTLLYDLVTLGRFTADLWIFKNRKWRK